MPTNKPGYYKEWIKRNKKKKTFYDRKYYLANRQRQNYLGKIARLRRFGITEQDYLVLFERQNGLCAICRKPEEIVDPRNGKVRALAVDHNHKTGQIRELLCGSCNRALGFLKEDLLRAESLATYIRKHQ